MWDFMEKLINAVAARSPEFSGISSTALTLGQLHLGLKEQTVFPESSMTKWTRFVGSSIHRHHGQD